MQQRDLGMAGPLTITSVQIYCGVCFQRVFKTGQYLMKLRVRKLTASIAVCARALFRWKMNLLEMWQMELL